MRVAAYCRVSTEEQAGSGLGVEAQQQAIIEECKRRGWRLEFMAVDQGVSAKYGVERPALDQVRELCRTGEADILMAAKLDRFARSSRFLSELLEEANGKKGYRIVFLDMGGVDSGTAAGKMFCQMLGVFAEFERDLIAERTSIALAAKAARGEPVGRPKEIMQAMEDRIWELSGMGLSTRRIADLLNHEGVPAPRGGQWGRSTIQAVLRRRRDEAGQEDVELDRAA